MLKHHFFIKDYNWEIHAFYYVKSIHKPELYKILCELGYWHIIDDICIIGGVLNGGYCYSNFKDKVSIMIVNEAENLEQLCNTIVHELNHLSSHIEEYFRIDSHSEKACYLIGDLAQEVSYFLRYNNK